MSGINDRLSALSPQQRELLTRRLQSVRAMKSASNPVTVGKRTDELPVDDPPPAPVAPFDPGKKNLKWSLFFFASTDSGSAREHYRLVTECARFADRHGFEAIWFPERHFDRFGAAYPSPAVLAGAVSTITERLQIRAGSVVLPLHDPIRVAEDWAVVDNLSGGRAGVSFASGWHANDFVFAPDTYAERKQVLLDKLAEVRQLWAGEPVKRIDGNGQPIDVCAYPLPERGALPLWITSSARLETWLTAATENMSVLTGLMEQTVDEVADKAAAYRARLVAMGRDPDQRDVTLMAHTFIGTHLDEVRDIVHDPLVAYLRAHIELFAKLARSGGLKLDLDRVTEADKQVLADMAFDRYFSTHGLFGTPESAQATVERFRTAGVTEIACLVDFGVAPELVLTGLTRLAELRELSAVRSA